ncbi:hypothetical protein IH979_01545 [Patescibacteria group bacterium]|nr:hypothetical protein [Patescibacteria group bacterium]
MTTTERKPPLNYVGTHRYAHFDEQAALVITEFEGRNCWSWPNGKPKRVFLTGDEEANRLFKGRDDRVLIGTGGGLFDEHKPSGRLKGTCSAKLVAEYLGVHKKPEYQLILREALRADIHKDSETGDPDDPETWERDDPRRMELANIIKTLHNFSQLGDEGVYQLVRRVLLAYRVRERGDEPLRSGLPRLEIPQEHRACLTQGSKSEDKPPLREIVLPAYGPFDTLVKGLLVLWYCRRFWSIQGAPEVRFVSDQLSLAQYFGKDDVVFVGIEGGQFGPEKTVQDVAKDLGVHKRRELRLMIREADKYRKNPTDQKPFELGRVVEVLNGYSNQMQAREVFYMVKNCLQAYRNRAYNTFVECPKEFQEKLEADEGEAQEFDLAGTTVAMVASEQPAMVDHLRSIRKFDITVIANDDSKLVFARTDSKDEALTARNSRAFRSIVHEIIRAEAKIEGASDDVVEAWLAEVDEIFKSGAGRELPGCDWWYLFIDGYGLMNGSTTHKCTRETPLTNKQFGEAVLQGIVAALEASE